MSKVNDSLRSSQADEPILLTCRFLDLIKFLQDKWGSEDEEDDQTSSSEKWSDLRTAIKKETSGQRKVCPIFQAEVFCVFSNHAASMLRLLPELRNTSKLHLKTLFYNICTRASIRRYPKSEIIC